MTIKNVLAHLTWAANPESLRDYAVGLARLHEARLTVLYVVPEPYIPGYVRSYIPEDVLAEQRRQALAKAEEMKNAFVAYADKQGVKAEWRQQPGDIADVATLHSRYTDLVIVGQTDPETKGDIGVDLAEELVLSCGRPVLVVPYVGKYADRGKRVMVAWTSTREATRAVHDSLPLLRKAEKVIIYSVNPTDRNHIAGADIAAHLAQHGIKTEAHHSVAKDLEVGDALLSAAADYGVDLLVMGAYGHSRLREYAFGGATRHLLEHMTMPVLMAH